MVKRVVYNNKAFKIINQYGFKFSNNEVTFNDIIIDFTGCSIADIPYKYQEIKIMQADTEENILINGEILFTGYLDDINLSDMKKQEEFREITLTLLSPLKLATKRSVTLIGTYELKTAIERIIQPLIDDGFILKEINVPEGQITTNFVLETVEYCMNNIGFKRNIFWCINEKKEIFINAIDYLFGLYPTKTISQDKKEDGLLKIQPKIENVDYANVINFKNVRLIDITDEYKPVLSGKKIKKGDIITFDYPIIISEDILRQFMETQGNTTGRDYFCFSMAISFGSAGNFKIYEIKIPYYEYSDNFNQYIISNGITFDGDEEDGEVVLQKDSFYSNLYTGFKWNPEEDIDGTIYFIESQTMLRYTTMRFIYSAEIEKLKGIISKSGQIEKTIDYNERWTFLTELIEYARSLTVQNSNTVNQVALEYDTNPNLKIGDIVEINKPGFYIQGKFAVKDISYTFNNELQQDWQITLKNADLISTYIDMFRPTEQEESEDTINTVILSEFVEEQINETHSLELQQTEHTLNFIL